MTDPRECVTPKKDLAEMQIVRLGNILFCLAIPLLAFMIFAEVSTVAVIGFYVLLVLVAMLSLFLLLLNDGFRSLFDGAEAAMGFAQEMLKSWVVTVPITICICAAAIICLCQDKSKRSLFKIIFCGAVMAFAVVVGVINIMRARSVGL